MKLNKFIEIIEDTIGKKAEKTYLDLQPGDVKATYADIDDLMRDVGFKPSTPLETGVRNFVEWYREYHGV